MSMKREVFSRTVAGILTAIVLAMLWNFWGSINPSIGKGLGWISGTSVAIWNWLLEWAFLPRWVFLILAVIVGLTVVQRAWSLWRRFSAPKGASPIDFVEFQRFGIVWRWRWYMNSVKDLNGYCPVCDRLMKYREDTSMVHPLPTEFFCPRCESVCVRRDGLYKQTTNEPRPCSAA